MYRVVSTIALVGTLSVAAFADDSDRLALIPNLPASPAQMVSTVPPNGDVNPYGVAFVPPGFPADGLLKPGDILVSNFNDKGNLQGTGTTIVSITPQSKMSVFFHGPSGLGLSTALGVLKQGFVLVGNVPTKDGMCGSIQQGSLIILDRFGKQVANLTDKLLLDGPWDLTISQFGPLAQIYVSNVLNGVVSRIDMVVPDGDNDGDDHFVFNATQIASGYAHRCDPNALVVGPTGLALDAEHDILYVASTGDNEIFAVAHPAFASMQSGKGTLVVKDDKHLHGPLALVLAPNGDLVTTNGDAVNTDNNQPSEMVEFSAAGKFVAERPVNSSGIGGAFGIALSNSDDGGLRFAAVDDILNALDVWIIRL